jgi:hypothetical protein
MLNTIVAGFMGKSDLDESERVDTIVHKIIDSGIQTTDSAVDVSCTIRKGLIYSEVEVVAAQTVIMPVDLSFISFPKEITITKKAICMVQDGDGFLRIADDAFALEDIARRLGDVEAFFAAFFGI